MKIVDQLLDRIAARIHRSMEEQNLAAPPVYNITVHNSQANEDGTGRNVADQLKGQR